VRAGILEPRDDDETDLEQAILRDDTLNDRQKRALVQVYRSFQHENE
jgi:hypothetical protein